MWSPSDALKRQFQQSQRRLSESGLSATATAAAAPPASAIPAEDGGLHAVTASASAGDETVRSAVGGNTYTRRQVGLGAAVADSESPVNAAAKRTSHGGGGAPPGSTPRYWEPYICTKCRQHGHDSTRCPQNAPVCDMCGRPDHTDALDCPGQQLLLRSLGCDRSRGTPLLNVSLRLTTRLTVI